MPDRSEGVGKGRRIVMPVGNAEEEMSIVSVGMAEGGKSVVSVVVTEERGNSGDAVEGGRGKFKDAEVDTVLTSVKQVM